MIAVSDDYGSHRVGDFGMDPPEIVVLPPGTFFEWARETGRLGGQNKVPRIASSEEMVSWLMERGAAPRARGTAPKAPDGAANSP